MAHYFSDEIYEILLRLPVKSLVRFTCVSKAWCSMIRSPSFAFAHLAHTNRSHNNHGDRILLLAVFSESRLDANHGHRYIDSAVITACLGKQVTEQDQSIKLFDEYKELKFSHKSLNHFRVVGSCNGLVLIKHYVDTLVLWNPLLGNIVTLPKPDNIGYEECQLRSIGWGFGFDSKTNDCKVVKIVCLQNNGSVKLDSLVQVFSLSTGYWKSFRVAAPACRLNHDAGGPHPFINGAIHWLASAQIASDVWRNSILSFDISNEIFREIMLPERLVPVLTNYCLDPIAYSISVYGKSLALCVGDDVFHSLWVMKEYGEVESWTEVLNCKTLEDIPKPVLGFRGKVDYFDIPQPLGFTTNGEVLWEAGVSGEVASYDPKSPEFRCHISENGRGLRGYSFAGSYVESLVLLNESNQKQVVERRGSKKRKRRDRRVDARL